LSENQAFVVSAFVREAGSVEPMPDVEERSVSRPGEAGGVVSADGRSSGERTTRRD
jgi:hypothetical protein